MQPPATPGAAPGHTRRHIEGDLLARVAEPGHHAAVETHPLGQALQVARHLPVEQLEVAGAVDRDAGQAPEQPIETTRQRTSWPALVAAIALDGLHHQGAAAPALEHVGQQLGRVLQVGIEGDENPGRGMRESVLKAGLQRRFLAEIAREAQHPQRRMLACQALQAGGTVVVRAVIHGDQPDARLRCRLLRRAQNARHGQRQPGCFVEHRHDEAQLVWLHAVSAWAPASTRR